MIEKDNGFTRGDGGSACIKPWDGDISPGGGGGSVIPNNDGGK